jgi:phospholipase/carboxylesterase
MMTIYDFNHRYLPGDDGNSTTLILLHGTGGNENSLLDMGGQLAPGAAMLGLRGNVLENGYPRFFRRLAEGIFDMKDLKARTYELADYLPAAAAHYKFDLDSAVAVGYSNGANIAASVLLLRPGVLKRAVLFRSMLPLTPETAPDLNGTSVLMTAGRMDNLIPPTSTQALADMLQKANARVELQWLPVDHRLTIDDLTLAQQWIGENGNG